MDIITKSDDERTELHLTGRFDAFEVDAFNAAIDPLVAEAEPDIAVDLRGVEFIDSSGLAALVRAMKRARQADGELTLLDPSDPVTVILELTRLDAAFDIQRP